MGMPDAFALIEDKDVSGVSQGCKANIPQKKKNRAVQAEKIPAYGRKHASSRHAKTDTTEVMSQKQPLKADSVIPAVMKKKGIRNGQRRDMAVN